MIYGIGTDIVQVARMATGLQRFGARLPQRILTAAELHDFAASRRPAHFLAKRFAAKEAAAKALGTGFRDGLLLRHIGVRHAAGGRPVLEFLDTAGQLCRRLGIGEAHLSLADEADYAVAFVTLCRS